MVIFIITVMIIRLRWYESASVEDIKHGKVKVESFVSAVPFIPIKKEDYNNNPDLLNAMIVVHLE